MSAPGTDAALTDAEIDRLTELIAAVSGGKGMSVEWVDGYMAAVLCTPTLLPLNDYLPPIFGAASMDEIEFEGMEQVQETVAALMHHRNGIAAALLQSLTDKEVLYWPILLEGDDGIARGNEWVQGFLRGTAFDPGDWAALLDDEARGGALIPMFALAHENDPDPGMRAGPFDTPEKRDSVLQHLIVGLVKAYAYFAPARRALAAELGASRTVVRESSKVGRNEPCPCGSGRKYKHCHGAQ